MKIKDFKNYLPFILSIIFFLILLCFSIYTYIEINNGSPDKESNVEVTLPIMNWNKYTSLSKEPYIDKIVKEATKRTNN